MIIVKGDKFRCIRTVEMSDDEEVAYVKGKIYKSHNNGCITNEQGDKLHEWRDEPGEDSNEDFFERYIEAASDERPLDPQEIKNAIELYKLSKMEPSMASDETITARILKIARLLRNG